ncbi:50S ribosome-binding GTPase [Candidatus Micrarchaeota archaeon]|nr:50S ribosome-binding GTPase [Candidatus Micrarchaeota archaeon]
MDLVDYSFRKASKVTARTRQELALKKVFAVRDAARSYIEKQTEPYELSEFEVALLSTSIDFGKVRREAAHGRTSVRVLRRLADEYEIMIKHAPKMEAAARLRSFYGRAASVLKRVAFSETEKLREEEKKLPRLRKDIPAVLIVGCPNVGKSQLLKQLTGSGVMVAPYPFTTKQILVGVARNGHDEVQLIDTPGLLDRPADKRNKIEARAITALKFLSSRVLFVLDASETCGYTLDEQLHLLDGIKEEFNPRVFLVNAKADLASHDKADFQANLLDRDDCEKLRRALFGWVAH